MTAKGLCYSMIKGSNSGMGTHASTLVPLPGSELISTAPPTLPARVSILDKPWPMVSFTLLRSKPRPSSLHFKQGTILCFPHHNFYVVGFSVFGYGWPVIPGKCERVQQHVILAKLKGLHRAPAR